MTSLYEEIRCAVCGAALSTAGICPNQHQHIRQRLDAEAATAKGCSRCGFMALTGHDCPEPRPAEPALPGEIDPRTPCPFCGKFSGAAHSCAHYYGECSIPREYPTPDELLNEINGDGSECEYEAKKALRAHIAAQQAVIERLRANGAAKLSTIHALCDDEERLKREVRIEALLWVCGQAMCADWRDLGERIKAELSRLRSSGEGRREGE